MTDDLFTVPDDLVKDETIENALEILVGEGKKFKTAEDLAKSKIAADRFIEQLKAEKAQAMEELKGRLKLEDLMTKLEESNRRATATSTVVTTTAETQPNTTTPNANNTLTKEDVEKLLVNREKEITEKNNLRFVAEQLKSTYGDGFQNIVNQKMKDLDMTVEYLGALAKERPNAFLKLMGSVPTQEQSRATVTDLNSFIPKSSINSGSFSSKSGPPKKFSDFEKIRRSDPRVYATKAIQDEMFKLTAEYGDAFLKS